MVPFSFGNWLVTNDGIQWTGNKHGDEYFISRESIEHTGMSNEEYGSYYWPKHLTEKLWISESDLYAFNTAFVFAFDQYNLDLDASSLAKSLHIQQILYNNRNKGFEDLLQEAINSNENSGNKVISPDGGPKDEL